MPIDYTAMIPLHRGVDVLGDALPVRPRAAAHKRVPPRSGLLARIDAWFWRQRQRALDAYLGQSQDLFELERRIRDLERNIGSRYY
jgi:hypothetical protein